MTKSILSTLILTLLISMGCYGKSYKVKSPSGELNVTINHLEGNISLLLNRDKELILDVEPGKFIFDKGAFTKGYVVDNIKRDRVRTQWSPVYGERSVVNNNYNELVLTLSDMDNSDKRVTLECRVYDEGVAFRSLFDSVAFAGDIIQKELTSFNFNDNCTAWVSDKAQGEYREVTISEISEVCERPLVINQKEQNYLAIGEAALVDYARVRLIGNSRKEYSLRTELDGAVDLKIANYRTPWRYVMVADSPGQLLENNYFVCNLNEPNQIADLSWIKPGKVIREVTLTTKGGLACIDFAEKHNLQYIEFDAGWYGSEYDDASDASTVTVDPKRSPGPLDLQKVIDYGKERGVGVILYVNRRALETQLDEILPLYQKWGVEGLKYGFVNVGSQEWTNWLHDAVRKAAKYELMVDIHDEYRPTGYSRTYPNLMTQEGIRGDEESPSPEQTLSTLFTRMVAGAGDNTNCYLASRVYEKMGGKAGQMAKSILLYSPWQFLYWYDRPEKSDLQKGGAGDSVGKIVDSEDLNFYDALPTVWDETEVLEGSIGEYATIARRSGDSWFIGSLTSNSKRTVMLSMDFLDGNTDYTATIYSQDRDDLKENIVNIKQIEVNRGTVLSQELISNSGFALVLTKK